MRIWIAAVILASAATTHAERLIYIPTARKIPFGMVKYEFRAEPRKQGEIEHYLGIGLTPFWELEIRSQHLQLARPVGTFDLTYNYISPLTNLTPGISFGVQDILSRTAEGTRPFFALTFRQGFFAIGGEFPADLTLALSMAKGRLYPEVGVSIPFSEAVYLLAEHDGFRLSAGMEVRPVRNVGFRFIVRDQKVLLGLTLQRRF